MINLTKEQVRALSETHASPLQLLKPQTNEAFVLLRVDEYKHLTEDAYDDKPWAREELQAWRGIHLNALSGTEKMTTFRRFDETRRRGTGLLSASVLIVFRE